MISPPCLLCLGYFLESGPFRNNVAQEVWKNQSECLTRCFSLVTTMCYHKIFDQGVRKSMSKHGLNLWRNWRWEFVKKNLLFQVEPFHFMIYVFNFMFTLQMRLVIVIKNPTGESLQGMECRGELFGGKHVCFSSESGPGRKHNVTTGKSLGSQVLGRHELQQHRWPYGDFMVEFTLLWHHPFGEVWLFPHCNYALSLWLAKKWCVCDHTPEQGGIIGQKDLVIKKWKV